MALRVAVVTESFLPSLNGVTNSVVRVLDSLKQNGHEAIVFAPTSHSTHYLGYPVIRINRVYIKQFAVAIPHMRLERMLRDFNPDVIHVAAPFAFGRQAISVAKRMGIPAIAIFQTDIAGYMQRYGVPLLRPVIDRLVGAIHRRASLNLAPTAEGAEYLRKIGAQHVEIWGRGVDLETYRPVSRATLGKLEARVKLDAENRTIIGFVGRLAAEKQVHRFKELFSLPNVSFLIVGDGPERANLEKLFKQQHVEFAGKLTGQELARAYASMDIFVHCGTEETFGQTIQEAQASGLPVVAPARGGPTSLIQSGVDGILVNPDEAGSYLAAVSELISDPKLRESISKNARQAVAGKSWAANNEQLLNYYQLEIANNRSKTRSEHRELVR